MIKGRRDFLPKPPLGLRREWWEHRGTRWGRVVGGCDSLGSYKDDCSQDSHTWGPVIREQSLGMTHGAIYEWEDGHKKMF